MISSYSTSTFGTEAALTSPDQVDRFATGVKDQSMEKKLNRRSLQDDAFDAEESITRRNRVMGQEFTDQIEDEMLDEKLEKNDISLLQNKSDKTLEWLYENQDEDNDVYRKKYDELELEFKNILSKQIIYTDDTDLSETKMFVNPI